MGFGIEIRDVGDVRRMIAAAFLEQKRAISVGSVILRPHQVSAVARISSAMKEFGGALLADDVGLGKTFVAAALMKEAHQPLLVIPASLKPMWRDALERTDVKADVLTFEGLSRTAGTLDSGTARAHDLVIVDEAHHARNPATRRYSRLSALVSAARVLLLSATPFHNTSYDLITLLGLFLGRRARVLSEGELSRCVVRRERDALGPDVHIPSVSRTVYHPVPVNEKVVELILDLPPALPPRGGGVASGLVAQGLLHMAASSDAALLSGVRRRIARAEALISALEAGTYPTARELETWCYAEGSLQLGFAELLADSVSGTAPLLCCVRAHGDALREILAMQNGGCGTDAGRAQILRGIRQNDPAAPVAAFSQYSATVGALFRILGPDGHVAALTGAGGRVAGGAISRRAAIERFAPVASGVPPAHSSEAVTLLLTTDILSEGVNLQDASIVVHLDLPWTSARMSQRAGRLARIGSKHRTIQVHCFRPPAAIERVLHGEGTIGRKWSLAAQQIGVSSAMPYAAAGRSDNENGGLNNGISVLTENLRSILTTWMRHDSNPDHNGPQPGDGTVIAACTRANSDGFLALGERGGFPVLLTLVDGAVSDTLSDVTRAAELATRDAPDIQPVAAPDEYNEAHRRILGWANAADARSSAGLSTGASLGYRRRLVQRVDAILLRSPPLQRAQRRRATELARQVVTGTWGASVERVLDELARASADDDDAWLAAINDVAFRAGAAREGFAHNKGDGSFRLRALLLFRGR